MVCYKCQSYFHDPKHHMWESPCNRFDKKYDDKHQEAKTSFSPPSHNFIDYKCFHGSKYQSDVDYFDSNSIHNSMVDTCIPLINNFDEKFDWTNLSWSTLQDLIS